MYKKIKQHDLQDCGAACMATICRYFKLKIPMANMRELMRIDRNGASLYAITETAKKLHLKANALNGSWEELLGALSKEEVTLPAIFHICKDQTLAHYVVVLNITKKDVKLFDPAQGIVKYKTVEFKELWTGYVVTFQKGADFQAGNIEKGSFGTYWHIIGTQKKQMFLVFIFSLLIASFSILTSTFYEKVIDQYILKGTVTGQDAIGQIPILADVFRQFQQIIDNFQYLFFAVVVLYLLQFLLSLVRGVILSRISRDMDRQLSHDFVIRTMRLPLSFFQNRETGEILSRFQDMDEIRQALSGAVLTIIFESVMMAVGAYILIHINVRMFFIVLILVLIYAVIVLLYRRPIREINQKTMEQNAKVTSALKEGLDGIDTIKSFAQEKKYGNKIIEKINQYVRLLFHGSILEVTQSELLNMVQGLGVIFVLWAGSVLVLRGTISLGSLIVFQSLMQYFISPVQQLVGLQPQLQQAMVAVDRLNDILKATTEQEIHEGDCEIQDLQRDIAYEDVMFRYGYRKELLRNVNLKIGAGEKVAIRGDNGSGKTTLIKLLGGYYEIESGKICIGGKDIRELSLASIRKHVAYVSQSPILFSGKLLDNLQVAGENVTKESDFQHILSGCCLEEMINTMPFGIQSILSENGSNLSGGQRQRIALARALLSNPDILILDEATSQLDEKTEEKIIQFIMEYMHEKIVIIITHNSAVANMCDREIQMDHHWSCL